MIELENFEELYNNMINDVGVRGLKAAFNQKNVLSELSYMLANPEYLEYDFKKNTCSIIKSIEKLKEKNLPLYKAIYCVAFMKRRKDLFKFLDNVKRRYGDLVPFYLSAYKEHMNINYNQWQLNFHKYEEYMSFGFGDKLWREIWKANEVEDTSSGRIYYRYDYTIPRDKQYFKELKEAYLKNITDKLAKPRGGIPYVIEEEGKDEDGDGVKTYLNRFSLGILNTCCLLKLYEANPRIRTRYTLGNLKRNNFDNFGVCLPIKQTEEQFMF